MVELQNKIFNIVVIVVVLLFLILFAVNAAYWNRIRNSPIETTPVTRDEANVQFWLNIVWLIIAIIVLIYAIVDIFYSAPTVAYSTTTVIGDSAGCPLIKQEIPPPALAPVCPFVRQEITPPVVSPVCPFVRQEIEAPACPIARRTEVSTNATPLYMLPKRI